MDPSSHQSCPHCGKTMARWENPDAANWTGSFQFVCFNDECPYFVRGWEWMEKNFGTRASYRHRLDPATGQSGPLPVWSESDFRDRIIENGEGASDAV